MGTIKVRENGPYLVDCGEDVTLIDWNGVEYQIPKRPFVLCRCGHSGRKPFCDGTHKRIGFQAAEAAAPPTVQPVSIPTPSSTDDAPRTAPAPPAAPNSRDS